eukprot:scaffold483346_cov31-Prasinocladus_malaysianus.AAC.2
MEARETAVLCSLSCAPILYLLLCFSSVNYYIAIYTVCVDCSDYGYSYRRVPAHCLLRQAFRTCTRNVASPYEYSSSITSATVRIRVLVSAMSVVRKLYGTAMSTYEAGNLIPDATAWSF